ncbi:MAG TPA: hypothetical protein VKL40_06790 [Candidatus Angelobacter sp.]|nr:hypothetical protein [Candidatus Angelobacter sp.]
MPKPPNPINQGFRAVLRDPTILLTEIVWRWSFGSAAFLLLFFSVLSLLGSMQVSETDTAAWRSNNPTLMAQALANILIESGPRMAAVAGKVLPVITLFWVILSSAGRTLTLNRLEKGTVSFRTVLALHCARAVLLWLAAAGLTAAVLLDARVATRGLETDLFLYYALVFWSVVLIGGFWAMLNWYLSLAPIVSLQSGAGALKSTRQAVRLVKKQGGDFGGISLIFGIYRLVLLAVAFVLCVLPSGLLGTAPRAYTAWVVVVSLVYFAFGDLLYLARMAAYLIAVSPETAAVGMGEILQP